MSVTLVVDISIFGCKGQVNKIISQIFIDTAPTNIPPIIKRAFFSEECPL
jgi:hypothetical protein